MYQTLIENEKLLAQLCVYDVIRFEALYRGFEEAWQTIKLEKLGYAGQQALRSAGHRYAYDKREQLLSVLLWAHLHLHPQAVSRLLFVHVSTFARIRQRVLMVLHRLNVTIDVPDRTAYRELDQLRELYPALLQLPLAAFSVET